MSAGAPQLGSPAGLLACGGGKNLWKRNKSDLSDASAVWIRQQILRARMQCVWQGLLCTASEQGACMLHLLHARVCMQVRKVVPLRRGQALRRQNISHRQLLTWRSNVQSVSERLQRLLSGVQLKRGQSEPKLLRDCLGAVRPLLGREIKHDYSFCCVDSYHVQREPQGACMSYCYAVDTNCFLRRWALQLFNGSIFELKSSSPLTTNKTVRALKKK